ncbi:MAG: flavodoxin family protein [Candidatus Loosdrechtia sp.]|uniref:flavodoxin family protein n=1 Tax=Candidatus Loosdrechtia sp. TaxID=3101272 RepID=UPI003A7004FC|nr:MAG: flavodoxin family protein [Candidatus Jettenia sp. AMX2]
MKKVVGIFGSPRPDGNSDTVLNYALRGAAASGASIEKIYVRDIKIAPCNSCGGCFEKGVCVIRDDMQKVYSELTNTDGILVSSPLYFMGVTAQLKALIDRCQSFWAQKYILRLPIRKEGKIAQGLFLATAARSDEKDLFTGAVKTIKAFFHVVDTRYKGDLLCPGLEGKGEVNKKEALLQQAYNAGRQLCTAGTDVL